jgi:hypothetical protein
MIGSSGGSNGGSNGGSDSHGGSNGNGGNGSNYNNGGGNGGGPVVRSIGEWSLDLVKSCLPVGFGLILIQKYETGVLRSIDNSERANREFVKDSRELVNASDANTKLLISAWKDSMESKIASNRNRF